MKLKAVIAALVCMVCASCMVLAGCSSVDKSLYVGTWTMQSSNDETFDADTMELMKTLDVQVSLTLNEDGTGTLNMLGNDPHDVTWEATSNTEGTATIDGGAAKLSLEEGSLTLEDAGGVVMTFARSEASAASASASAASASTESAAASSAAVASGAAAEGDATASAQSADDTAAAEGAAAEEGETDEAGEASTLENADGTGETSSVETTDGAGDEAALAEEGADEAANDGEIE